MEGLCAIVFVESNTEACLDVLCRQMQLAGLTVSESPARGFKHLLLITLLQDLIACQGQVRMYI